MKIVIARTAGFCMGVKRAVDLALDSAASHPHGGVYTLGPLIHNNQSVEMLNNRGVRQLEAGAEPPLGTPLLIRAHGVPPDQQNSFVKRGHVIIDGTCPKVKTVHRVIEKYRSMGHQIVIAGDKGHAEVVGLLGYARENGHLIQSADDVQRLPAFSKVCLVAQTTFDKQEFDVIAAMVKERFGAENVVVKKTICAATEQRQSETRELARRVDAMIVVGGKNSANTRRLAKIAGEGCTRTQHVETEGELDWEQLADCSTVGITAGASTPNWMIKRVVDQLQFLAQTHHKTPTTRIRRLLAAGAYINVFVASGAAAVYYASCFVQGLSFRWSGAALAFLYFLSMHLWNSLSSMDMTQHHGIGRYRFYNAHKRLLYSVSGISILSMLAMSWIINVHLFYLMAFATLVGSVYHVTIVPQFLRPLVPYRTLKDIPTSRDLFVALAWGVLLTFIPQALAESPIFSVHTGLCFFWVFFLAYTRSVVFDLRDIEGDRIMGRETLVTFIGEQRVRGALRPLLALVCTVLLMYPLVAGLLTHSVDQKSVALLSQAPVLLYIYVFAKRNRRVSVEHPTLFNILADGPFYLAGALAVLVAKVLQFTVG